MISVALFFAGMALGIALAFALIRAERSTPSPLPRSRPGTSQVSEPARAASSHPSNVRRVPRWEQDYAARYLDECRKYGQAEVDRRHSR